ncbi:MAG: AarF/ABC1/UbiB kinase family protein [Candidatus Dormibacteraeota bacterium]|nr:AarF/ABC1/UbiB kinase family protein [Candidatus Dormibacteraeota bacterium]
MPGAAIVLIGGASIAFTVGVLALSAHRLLGLQVGLARAVLAGVVGFLVWAGVGYLQSSTNAPSLVGLTFGIGILATAAFLALAEVVLPSDAGRGPFQLYLALLAWLSRTRRYWQVVRIGVQHGLWPYLRGRRHPQRSAELARSLRLALEEAGPTFVKLGQFLSTRHDLLPPLFVEELRHLQSRVAPAPWEEIEQVMAAELGAQPQTLFTDLDSHPLAAASIAQVHAARLRSGEEVVLKVERPGIQPGVRRDLDIVRRLAVRLERRSRWATGVGAVDLAEGFAAAVEEEMDFRVEARNLAAVAAVNGTDGPVRLPRLYPELSSGRVLVMERLTGVPLSVSGPTIDVDGPRRTELARTLLASLLRQILIGGTFHADPHPGNVLLGDGGQLALIDFGSVGRLDAGLRSALQRLLQAIDHGDGQDLADALLEVVPRPDEIDEPGLERALGRFAVRYLTPGTPPLMDMFTELFRLISRYELAVPGDVAAVFRSLATLEGTLSVLAPRFDIVAESRAFASDWIAEELRPESLEGALREEVNTLVPLARRMPRRLDRITSSLEQGRLSGNVRLFADQRDRRFVAGLVHEVLITALAVTSGLMAVLLLGAQGGPVLARGLTLFQLIGYYLLVVSGLLMLRVLLVAFRPSR